MSQKPPDLATPLNYATPSGVERPIWVKVGLWGLPNRESVWACFWISIVIGVASAILGFINPLWFAGVFMSLAAPWYWACIRWVDENGAWK